LLEEGSMEKPTSGPNALKGRLGAAQPVLTEGYGLKCLREN
jgi:hypothetical protein